MTYYILRQLTFVSDPIIYGKKQSKIAQEIREELLKRTDIRTVSFVTEDHLKLVGYLFTRLHAQANVLLCHGYRGSKEFMYGYIDMFPQCNVLMFDFRAHGQSEGDIISIGCHEYKDVIAAAKYMKQLTKGPNGKDLPMIFVGVSMGGSSAIKAAEHDKGLCNALIIDSAYSDLRRMMLRGFTLRVGLPYYPFFPMLKFLFQHWASCDISMMNVMKSVENLTLPIMFIHSCNDSFTPPSHSLRLYAHSVSKNPKIWIGPVCRHGWLHSYYSDIYKKKVFKFLRKSGIVLEPVLQEAQLVP
jgi:pimeloyl-ACP methyl ester carboxylesterase